MHEQLDLPCFYLDIERCLPETKASFALNNSTQASKDPQASVIIGVVRFNSAHEHTGISRLSLLMRTSCSDICKSHYEACRTCGARRLKGALVGI